VRIALSLLATVALGALAGAQTAPEPPLEEPQWVIDARPTTDADPRPPKPDVVVGPTADEILRRLAAAMDDPQIAQQLLAVDPSRWETLPAPARLILADLLTRRGKLESARRLYGGLVTEGSEDSPWRQGARAGLGWIALVQNDRDGIRSYLASDADGAPRSALVRVLLALLDAGDARAGAAAELERLSTAADVPPLLRDVARIAIGYAHLWAGDRAAARRAFARITDGRFADDARYATAWSRHLDGDDDGAREALRAVAAEPSRGPRRRAKRSLIALQPRAVIGSGIVSSRDLHAATDEGWLGRAMDLDGVRLAHAALRLLASADAIPAAAATSGEVAAAHDPARASATVATPRAPAEAATERSSTWPFTSAVVIAMATLVLAWRRHTTGRSSGMPGRRL
jgi:hypothetical protein